MMFKETGELIAELKQLGRHVTVETAGTLWLENLPEGAIDLASVSLLKLAEVTAQEGDYAGSEKLYNQFLDKYPNDRFIYQAQFGVGWALENQKKYDEARSWYGKVIAQNSSPTAARAQFQIGETYFAQANYDQAAAALLAVADVYAYPEWAARAIFEAGRVFEQMKQPDQAKQQYNRDSDDGRRH